MEIKLNNEIRIVDAGTTVADIVGAASVGVAVAVNGKIVKKSEWSNTPLKDGDDVVVIRAAYGG